MMTCAECHPGINDQIDSSASFVFPGRKDSELFSHIERPESLFPGFVPVLIRNQVVVKGQLVLIVCSLQERFLYHQFSGDDINIVRSREKGDEGALVLYNSKAAFLRKPLDEHVFE